MSLAWMRLCPGWKPPEKSIELLKEFFFVTLGLQGTLTEIGIDVRKICRDGKKSGKTGGHKTLRSNPWLLTILRKYTGCAFKRPSCAEPKVLQR